MNAFEAIIYKKKGGIAYITLNRPKALNAINAKMRAELYEVLSSLDDDPEVMVAIIQGAWGGGFSAGADLKEFGSASSSTNARRITWERDIWGQLLGVSKPLIAAMHGYALGAGLELAMCCDIRIASDDARFGLPEVNLGMIPAAGGSQTMPRLAWRGMSIGYILTGETMNAAEALRIGLVNNVVSRNELIPAAEGMAGVIMSRSQIAVRYAKEAINRGLDLTLKQGLELERDLFAVVLQSIPEGTESRNERGNGAADEGKEVKAQEELIEEVADLIVKAKHVVVFTGAGISTESGIPDFRGPSGLWTKVDPLDFTYFRFVTSSEARKRLWGLSKTMGSLWRDVKPNAAHYAVAELEKLGKLDCVITQNVDGLHQKAGSSEAKVFQLHGNLQWAKCLNCRERYSFDRILKWLEAGTEEPKCIKCGGIIKPEGVFFGEALPLKEIREAKQRSQNCDLFIVIGSSLEVNPAAQMPKYAVKSGAKLVIINEGETSMDRVADVRIDGKAGRVMSQLVERVKQKLGSK